MRISAPLSPHEVPPMSLTLAEKNTLYEKATYSLLARRDTTVHYQSITVTVPQLFVPFFRLLKYLLAPCPPRSKIFFFDLHRIPVSDNFGLKKRRICTYGTDLTFRLNAFLTIDSEVHHHINI